MRKGKCLLPAVLSVIGLIGPVQPFQAAQYLTPAYVEASSVLGNQEGNNYSPWNIQDNDCSTAWVEGVGGTGTGEQLYLGITAGMYVTGGVIFPGYNKSEELFNKNAAPSSFRISSGGREELIDCSAAANTYYGQGGEGYTFYLQSPLESDGTVTITIASVRNGYAYEDTCISELYLFGESAEAMAPAPEIQPTPETQPMPDVQTAPDIKTVNPDPAQVNMAFVENAGLSGMAQWVCRFHEGYEYPGNVDIYEEDLSAEERSELLYWYQYNRDDFRISSNGEYNVAFAYDMLTIAAEICNPAEAVQTYNDFAQRFVEKTNGDLVYMNGTGDFGDAGPYYFEQPDTVWVDGERIAVSGRVMEWNSNASSYINVAVYSAFFFQNEVNAGGQQTFRFDAVKIE